jgi:hypothetical protein
MHGELSESESSRSASLSATYGYHHLSSRTSLPRWPLLAALHACTLFVMRFTYWPLLVQQVNHHFFPFFSVHAKILLAGCGLWPVGT